MATFRKVWQCRGLTPHPGLVGLEFPVLEESRVALGTGRVLDVGDDTITFTVEIPDAVVEAFGVGEDVRWLKVHRAKDDRGIIALVVGATLAGPDEKREPYAPMERIA